MGNILDAVDDTYTCNPVLVEVIPAATYLTNDT